MFLDWGVYVRPIFSLVVIFTDNTNKTKPTNHDYEYLYTLLIQLNVACGKKKFPKGTHHAEHSSKTSKFYFSRQLKLWNISRLLYDSSFIFWVIVNVVCSLYSCKARSYTKATIFILHKNRCFRIFLSLWYAEWRYSFALCGSVQILSLVFTYLYIQIQR